jgi:hypothetical protein
METNKGSSGVMKKSVLERQKFGVGNVENKEEPRHSSGWRASQDLRLLKPALYV